MGEREVNHSQIPSMPLKNTRTHRIRLCGRCDYYPATECGGQCCPYCESEWRAYQARCQQERQEQEALRLVEQEAARVRAEKKKQEFDQMAANAARKPGISFADVLKNKK